MTKRNGNHLFVSLKGPCTYLVIRLGGCSIRVKRNPFCITVMLKGRWVGQFLGFLDHEICARSLMLNDILPLYWVTSDPNERNIKFIGKIG